MRFLLHLGIQNFHQAIRDMQHGFLARAYRHHHIVDIFVAERLAHLLLRANARGRAQAKAVLLHFAGKLFATDDHIVTSAHLREILAQLASRAWRFHHL